jgi:hypothetical protein
MLPEKTVGEMGTITGLIKIYKQAQPIRPVVNWKNAPAFKLAKALAQKLTTISPTTIHS